jgi:hypothetical protein
VTFQALIIFQARIGRLPVLIMVVLILQKMHGDIFNTMNRLAEKKVDGIVRHGQVAIHAIRDKSLCIVDMGRSFPGIISKLNLMA